MIPDIKVIHVPFCFYPDPVGGTEVYVGALARHLQERGVQVVVAAPGERDATYVHDGLRVRRFALSQAIGDLRDLYGEGDVRAAQGFGRILDNEGPSMVHLHAFTRGASLRLVREAKRRGIPVLFTYHTPTVSCQRGTLMYLGRGTCDGRVDLHTCARCTLDGLGLSKMSGMVLGSFPTIVGKLAGTAGLSGGLWTALRMTELVELRHFTFRALMAEVDYVVALCLWAKDLLLRNGVPSEKVMVSRHGLPQVPPDGYCLADSPSLARGQLRIVYLGRLDPTKGLDVLIRALRSLPKARIELHLYGVVQGSGGATYLEQLRYLAADDPRIAFLPPVPGDRIVSLLRGYHLLAVPSQWLETGPLVVLEAFAAGIPVMGSNLGGIAELVEHEVNGLLVEPGSVEAWSRELERLSRDKDLLTRLRAGIRPPRVMGEVAEEMLILYRAILNEKTPRRRARAFK